MVHAVVEVCRVLIQGSFDQNSCNPGQKDAAADCLVDAALRIQRVFQGKKRDVSADLFGDQAVREVADQSCRVLLLGEVLDLK